MCEPHPREPAWRCLNSYPKDVANGLLEWYPLDCDILTEHYCPDCVHVTTIHFTHNRQSQLYNDPLWLNILPLASNCTQSETHTLQPYLQSPVTRYLPGLLSHSPFPPWPAIHRSLQCPPNKGSSLCLNSFFHGLLLRASSSFRYQFKCDLHGHICLSGHFKVVTKTP